MAAEQEAIAAAIPRSRLVVFGGAGHYAHVEEPERFARELVAFATSIAGAPAEGEARNQRASKPSESIIRSGGLHWDQQTQN